MDFRITRGTKLAPANFKMIYVKFTWNFNRILIHVTHMHDWSAL